MTFDSPKPLEVPPIAWAPKFTACDSSGNRIIRIDSAVVGKDVRYRALSIPSVSTAAADVESIARALGEETVRQLHEKVLALLVELPGAYILDIDLPLREPHTMIENFVFDPQWLIPGSASSVKVWLSGGFVHVTLKGQVA